MIEESRDERVGDKPAGEITAEMPVFEATL